MVKYKRSKIIMVIVLLIIIVSETGVYANKPGFDIDLPYTNQRFIEFVKKDRDYLNQDLDAEILHRQLQILNKDLNILRGRYYKTNTGAYVYGPDTVGKFQVLSYAIENRLNYLEAKKVNKKFKYSTDGFYTTSGGFGMGRRGLIPKEVYEVNFEEAKKVLNNIEIDNRYLKNLVVMISPVYFDRINAYSYSETFPGRNDVVVISNYSIGLPAKSEEHITNVRGSTLHELGHIYHSLQDTAYGTKTGPSSDINLDNPFWKDYSKLYNDMEIEKPNFENWENSYKENLAEDFRLYYSQRLGKYSHKTYEKKTVYNYNKDVEKVFAKYESKGSPQDKWTYGELVLAVEGSEYYRMYPDTKATLTVDSSTENVEINIDSTDAVYQEYLVATWDENENLQQTIKKSGPSIKQDIDFKDKYSNTKIITISIMDNNKPVQKWRIDVVKDNN